MSAGGAGDEPGSDVLADLSNISAPDLIEELRVLIAPRGGEHAFNGTPTLQKLLPAKDRVDPTSSPRARAKVMPALLAFVRRGIGHIPVWLDACPVESAPEAAMQVLNALYIEDPAKKRDHRRHEASKVVWPPIGRSADHFADTVEEGYLQALASALLHQARSFRVASAVGPPTSPSVVDLGQITGSVYLDFASLASVDLICSEIPEEELPYFARPSDRNYLRYARFADLDTLILVRTRLAQCYPQLAVRDFVPAEYSLSAAPDALLVIGGPPWNPKYVEFQRGLPFHFESHPLGQDDPLVVHPLGDRRLAPKWSDRGELLVDPFVFARITLHGQRHAYLLGGCLTLGVWGAGACFLDPDVAAHNIERVRSLGLVDREDFIAVGTTRRVGQFPQPPDFTQGDLVALLALDAGQFVVRYQADST